MRTQKVRQSPRRIRSDPIGSAINSRTVRQKVRQKSPPMSAKEILTNVRQSPPRTIIRRGQLSAADKVRKNFSKKNLHRNNNRRTIVRRRTMFAADMSAARGQMSATRGQTCQLLPDKYVNLSRTNMSAARG